MSIRKDPRSPYWQYDFQRNKQRFHGSTGCRTKRDAEKYESDLKRRVALGDDSKPVQTIDEACAAYWLDKGQHENNAATTKYQLANLCKLLGERKMIGDVRQADMRSFVAKRRATVSAASINRELSLMQRVMKHARLAGKDMPAPDTEFAIKWKDLKLAEPRERVRELSGDEQRKLFQHLDDDLAAVVEFAILSGQRRDAHLYDGPHPVVAHPPCQRWGKMWFGQPLTVKRTGVRKEKGADGGCFVAALAAVRRWGGVLEHPWQSHAWPHFGLNTPPREGGWVSADYLGAGQYGWTCCVEQGRYGHYARKPTLLYAVGCDLPGLDWGKGEARLDPAIVERMGLKRAKRLGEVGGKGGGKDSTPRIWDA